MPLNIEQEKGLKTIIARYNSGERYTVLSGYA